MQGCAHVWKGQNRGLSSGFVDRRREERGEERPAAKEMAIDGHGDAGGLMARIKGEGEK
jgi:hypothetical protein